MGSFFTSTQIYNPNLLDREQFINFFCEEMKKNGYVTSNSDESELSYILRFSDKCKWVTLTSEAYEQGNQFSQSDTGRIAKMLKTVCINTTVIDSDCVTLDLYDASGEKKDALIMGRADDYFGDDIPEPKESVWSSLLEKGRLWKQLLDVYYGNYVSVEEGLSKIAPIIGMDSEGILFSADSFSGDKRTVPLYFKSVAANKEKKLTLNAAFDMVFGDELKAAGFKKIKGRNPYYVKIVNEDIIHVLTYVSKVSGRRNQNAFEIYAGAASLYRDKIDLSVKPVDNIHWMCSSFTLFKEEHLIPQLRTQNEEETLQKLSIFYYEKDNNASLLSTLNESLKLTNQYLLPYINTITDINTLILYVDKSTRMPCTFDERFEGLLFLKTKDYLEVCRKKAINWENKYKLKLEMQKYGYSLGCSQEEFERLIRDCEFYVSKDIAPIEKVLNSPELRSKYNEILMKRKNDNTNKLKQYGLLIN